MQVQLNNSQFHLSHLLSTFERFPHTAMCEGTFFGFCTLSCPIFQFFDVLNKRGICGLVLNAEEKEGDVTHEMAYDGFFRGTYDFC